MIQTSYRLDFVVYPQRCLNPVWSWSRVPLALTLRPIALLPPQSSIKPWFNRGRRFVLRVVAFAWWAERAGAASPIGRRASAIEAGDHSPPINLDSMQLCWSSGLPFLYTLYYCWEFIDIVDYLFQIRQLFSAPGCRWNISEFRIMGHGRTGGLWQTQAAIIPSGNSKYYY